MSETRLMTKQGKITKVEGYTCTECGVWGATGEIHTYLFCELHKLGWDRETIIANTIFTADALRGASNETG